MEGTHIRLPPLWKMCFVSRMSLPFPVPSTANVLYLFLKHKCQERYSILEKMFIPGQIFFPISSDSLGDQHPCCYSLALYWSPRAGSQPWISVELEQGALWHSMWIMWQWNEEQRAGGSDFRQTTNPGMRAAGISCLFIFFMLIICILFSNLEAVDLAQF